jgi:hypothetical protein
MKTAILLLSFVLSLPAAEFIVGVCTHFSQGKGYLPGNLDLIKQAGVRSIRDEAGWRAVEREKGRLVMPAYADEYVEQAVKLGLEPMIILDYGNTLYEGGDKVTTPEAIEAFVRYSEFMVMHFKGKVRHWEIWNEYDISIGSRSPGTADDYVRLIQAVYPRIKKVDPAIIVYGTAVTGGGVRNGWLERVMQLGGLKFMDVVSIHTYNYSNSGRERTPEAWAEWMQQVQSMLQKYSGGKPVPLYITEMGWPTQVDRRGTPPEVAAAYLGRMYLLARTMPWLNGIWWYDFQDDGWKYEYNENNFGLVRADLTPKPPYFALASVAPLVGRAEFAGRVETGDPNVWILKFREPGGQDVWAIWSSHPDDGWQVTLRGGRGALTVEQVGGRSIARQWGNRNWTAGREGQTSADTLQFVAGRTPWLLRGDLSGVSFAGVTRREFPEAARTSVLLQ